MSKPQSSIGRFKNIPTNLSKRIPRWHSLHGRQRYRPFFIIGSPRSGNTLLRRLLTAHSQLHVPPETVVLRECILRFRHYGRFCLKWAIVGTRQAMAHDRRQRRAGRSCGTEWQCGGPTGRLFLLTVLRPRTLDTGAACRAVDPLQVYYDVSAGLSG